jgi:hypothetical protein
MDDAGLLGIDGHGHSPNGVISIDDVPGSVTRNPYSVGLGFTGEPFIAGVGEVPVGVTVLIYFHAVQFFRIVAKGIPPV